MKHLAVLSLACAILLANRRRRNSSHTRHGTTEPSQTATRTSASAIHPPQRSAPSTNAQAAAAAQAGPLAPPTPTKSVIGAVLQSIFLILLGAALSLTAAKGSWDVFAVLVAAAVLQLGSQFTRWLGAGSGGSGSRRARATPGSVGAVKRGGRPAGAGATGTGASDMAAPPRPLLPDPRIAGAWVKDNARSDTMDEATAAMRLNGLVRTAIRLIRGLEVDPEGLRAGRFDMAITSVIAFFKVRESYPLDGSPAHFNRRDLRKGQHTAFVAVQPDGSVVLSISWGEPLAGTGTDHFVFVPEAAVDPAAAAAASTAPSYGAAPAPGDGDLLVVTSTLQLEGSASVVTYRTTYVRAGRARHQHSQQSPATGHD